MPTSGIKVLFIGKEWDVPYNSQICGEPTQIMSHIAIFAPDVIITSTYYPSVLKTACFDLRKRWVHLSPESTNEEVISSVESCYSFNLWGKHQHQDDNPLVSVYTGTYNTGDVLRETYQSLRDQTNPNWEWCVVDDESTDNTFNRLMDISKEDIRVRPMRVKHNGKIGAIKDMATRMAYGEYLIELDHDDMLVDTAVADISNAFKDPDVGMVYTNCASFYPDGTPQEFNDAFWTPRYRSTEYRGKIYRECINPNIYDRTGPWHQHQFAFALLYGPNHARCYRASLLRAFGGYNRNLPVADDLDVYMRFFLSGSMPEEGHPKGMIRCEHIDKMLYLYRFHDAYSNTTFTRNKSIQDHVALCQQNYDQAFQVVNVRREKAVETQKKNAKWSFIVLDWNTKNITVSCLKSIKSSCPDAEIILVENGKPFDCALATKTIKLEQNIGFAGGCNRGALEATGEYICFLNSDARITSENIVAFERSLLQPGVAAVGPYSNEAKPPQGTYPTKFNIPFDVDIKIDSLSGFCLAIHRTVFNNIGGFDTQFCNFEDDDLCRRLKLAGYKMVISNTWVFHKEHTSFKANNVLAEERIEESRIKYNNKWLPIKVVAITLNEINSLPGYIEQFKNITNDFTILDSGSTDGTVEWARQNGVKVYSRAFDNFANQRNAALEYVGKDGGWVIMHDPDERLDKNTLDNLDGLMRCKDYDIYLLPLNALNYDGSITSWVPKPFMFRNSTEIKWINPVHEKVIGSLRQALIVNGMNTHHLSLHGSERRDTMSKIYDSLGTDAELDSQWPILNYHKRSDSRIKDIYLGPTISVIVPTFKRQELLKRAVDSIKSQDYINTEIVVVGDCDPDFSNIEGCHCLNLAKNHGAGGAEPRNYAIMLSSGKLIAYLDDDNMWENNHLSSVYTKMIETKSDYVFSSINLNGKLWSCDVPQRGKIDTSCLLHKRSMIQDFGFWKDRIEAGYAHDWEFVKPWVVANRPWAATFLATVIYNIETSGQVEYLNKIAEGL